MQELVQVQKQKTVRQVALDAGLSPQNYYASIDGSMVKMSSTVEASQQVAFTPINAGG